MGQNEQGHVVGPRAALVLERHHEIDRVGLLALLLLFKLLLLALFFLDIDRGHVRVLVAAKIFEWVHTVCMGSNAISADVLAGVALGCATFTLERLLCDGGRWLSFGHEGLRAEIHFLKWVFGRCRCFSLGWRLSCSVCRGLCWLRHLANWRQGHLRDAYLGPLELNRQR